MNKLWFPRPVHSVQHQNGAIALLLLILVAMDNWPVFGFHIWSSPGSRHLPESWSHGRSCHRFSVCRPSSGPTVWRERALIGLFWPGFRLSRRGWWDILGDLPSLMTVPGRSKSWFQEEERYMRAFPLAASFEMGHECKKTMSYSTCVL